MSLQVPLKRTDILENAVPSLFPCKEHSFCNQECKNVRNCNDSGYISDQENPPEKKKKLNDREPLTSIVEFSAANNKGKGLCSIQFFGEIVPITH